MASPNEPKLHVVVGVRGIPRFRVPRGLCRRTAQGRRPRRALPRTPRSPAPRARLRFRLRLTSPGPHTQRPQQPTPVSGLRNGCDLVGGGGVEASGLPGGVISPNLLSLAPWPSLTSTTVCFRSARRIVSHAASRRASIDGSARCRHRARPIARATATGAASATRAVTVTLRETTTTTAAEATTGHSNRVCVSASKCQLKIRYALLSLSLSLSTNHLPCTWCPPQPPPPVGSGRAFGAVAARGGAGARSALAWSTC
jgi:hypothetical protein